MKKEEYLSSIFNLFLKKEITLDLIISYLEEDDDKYLAMSDFINLNLKNEVSWSTSIGIIEAAEKIYKEAIYNGNIKHESNK
jgi:hypothetical protein